MVIYRERLWPSIWLVLAGMLVIPAVMLVITPVASALAAPIALAAYALFLWFLFATSPVIEVTDTELRAGRAQISRSYVRVADPESRESTRELLSTRSDARAHLVIRSWIPEAVRIELSDERDSTPYWLVSSRQPEKLANALVS